jgi:hypothetical protein
MKPPCIIYLNVYPGLRSRTGNPRRWDRLRAAWLAFTGRAIAVVEYNP